MSSLQAYLDFFPGLSKDDQELFGTFAATESEDTRFDALLEQVCKDMLLPSEDALYYRHQHRLHEQTLASVATPPHNLMLPVNGAQLHHRLRDHFRKYSCCSLEQAGVLAYALMSAASGAGKRPTTIVLRAAPASTEAEAILEIITGLLPNVLALFAPASAEVASALNSIPQHPVIIDGFHFSKSYTGVARTVKTHQLTPVYLRTQLASPTPLVIISGVGQQWRRDIFDWTIELSLHHRGHDSISTFDGVADLSELLQAWLQQSETQYEDRISFDQLHQLMSRAGSWHTVLNIANQCGESHYFNVWNFALAHAALDCAVDLDRIHILCREALKQGRTHIASDDLLRGLNAFRQQAVGETSAVMLARALGRYGVPPPQTVRLGPFETRKGYSVACILDALNPYFPCADAQQVV